jgi:hypothetical protein
MAIETNMGKARPRLPRSSDLPTGDLLAKVRSHANRGHPSSDGGTTPDPCVRDASGRFAPGNRSGELTGGWRQSVRKLLGNVASEGESRTVAADAWKLFRAVLADLPAGGPVVEGLAAEHARQSALAAFYAGKAGEAGLTSKEGLELVERASKCGARAERVAVTMHDLAIRAARREPPPIDLAALDREAEARMEEQRERERAAQGSKGTP